MKAFKDAKEALLSWQVLDHYDPSLPMKMVADASAYGIRALIFHIFADGSEHPIAFSSRSLTASEKKYAQIEKETLAFIFGNQKFHQYLFGREFVLLTDHKLLLIVRPKKGVQSLAAPRLQHWAICLSAYKYTIEFN